MANDPEELEPTELVDVSDVETSFDDETFRPRENEEPEPISKISGKKESEAPDVASLKDRFAAQAMDAMFLYVIYFAILIVYRSIVFGEPFGPIPAAGLNGIIFHGIFFLIALLWFAIPEMAFCASVGKLFCHLRVRSTNGEYPSFVSVIVRNLLRPIDIILFPLIIVAALMENSTMHRRLGDILGRTFVLKNFGAPPRQYALSLDIVASASARSVAFLIDFAFFALFGLGVALFLSPETPAFSMMVLVLSPILAFLFFTIPEWLTKTSPGKWLWGFAVCLEDGSAVDLQSTLVRTFWRVVDTNPVGFLTSLFSVRRQRPGDTAAGTVVIKADRKWQGFAGLICIAVISISTLYAGLSNRDSFMGPDFRVNFLPSFDFVGRGRAHAGIIVLAVKNFSFAAEDPASIRRPPKFEPGETLYITFEVDGYKRDKKKVWIQEDLTIRYPDDSIGLKLENINEFNREFDEEGPIKFENNIVIPDNAAIGRYAVTLAIRDKVAKREITEQRYFYVNLPPPRPASRPMPEPDEELPPPPPPSLDDDASDTSEIKKPPKNMGLRRPILDDEDEEEEE